MHRLSNSLGFMPAARLALFAVLSWLTLAGPAAARDSSISAQAERDVASGEVFLRRAMRPEAIAVLDAWAKPGAVGTVARRLAPKLDGAKVAAFMQAVAAEPNAERSEVRGIPGHGDRKQVMVVWEWSDGSILRYKPEGDRWRDAPTYSIEIKDSRNLSNEEARQEGIAFKVDPRGRAVPTGPRQVKYPTGLPKDQIDDYVDAVMDFGHRTLRR
jgi:hypothetical protein